MTNPTKKRNISLEGFKLLLGTGALVATISLWSFFSNQDRISALNTIDQTATATQAISDFTILLPPIPTLVPIYGSNTQQASAGDPPLTAQAQDLRSVSAPVVAAPSNNSPLVVTGTNRTNAGPVTSTSSS
jgi:hypothetical protein